MKQGWEIRKLGEVCDFQNGFAFQSKSYKESGLPILRITNIQNDEIDTKELVYFDTKDYKVNLDRFKVYQGDLLIAMSGATTGKLGINNSETVFYLNQRVGKFIPKKFLNKAFLYYFLTTKVEESLRIAAGAAQPNLSTEQINNFEIPLPPLPEQKHIVSILDEAFGVIAKAKANAEQNLKNAKELFESYLQGVFEKKGDDWEKKTLGQLCVFTQGIQRDVKLQSETQGENQVRFLRIVDYTQGNEPPRYIDFPGDKYILNADDVALVRYGASTGFVCRGLEGALANNLFRVIPKSLEKLTTDFLFIYLQSPIFQSVIKATMNGAAMPAISFGLIEEIPFPLPPFKEQQTIVRQLDALRVETQKLEVVYQKKMDDLEELKKSILQKAFAGELGGDEPAEPKTEKSRRDDKIIEKMTNE